MKLRRCFQWDENIRTERLKFYFCSESLHVAFKIQLSLAWRGFFSTLHLLFSQPDSKNYYFRNYKTFADNNLKKK